MLTVGGCTVNKSAVDVLQHAGMRPGCLSNILASSESGKASILPSHESLIHSHRIYKLNSHLCKYN